MLNPRDTYLSPAAADNDPAKPLSLSDRPKRRDRKGRDRRGTNKPKRERGASRLLFSFVCWCMLAIVVAAILIRSSNVSRSLTIAIAGLTAFAAIPLAIAVVGSFFSRQLILRLASGLVASVFFFVTTPMEAVIGCGPSESPGSSSSTDDELTILTANVLWTTREADELAKMMRETDADIVTLQELNNEIFDTLVADPSLANYTYKDGAQSNAKFFTATFAKIPVVPREAPPYNRRVTTTVFPRAQANPIGNEFKLTALHLTAPLRDENVAEWQDQLGSLAELPVDQPAILVGDFNATEDHRPFRNLLASGWTDVHQDKGCGLDTTFPSKERFPIGLMRIDHVLVTDHFEVVSVDILPTKGSDHDAVLARVRRNQG